MEDVHKEKMDKELKAGEKEDGIQKGKEGMKSTGGWMQIITVRDKKE